MIKKTCIFVIGVMLMISCSKKTIEPLRMDKASYTGNELRIDGYYYSDIEVIESNLSISKLVNFAVFYRDGFCILMAVSAKDGDIPGYIETEFLLNDSFISKWKAVPNGIGVFKIVKADIELELWNYSGGGVGSPITTFSYYGNVLDDTTFYFRKWVNNYTNRTYSKDLTFHFKPFSPKPDSTNVYIK